MDHAPHRNPDHEHDHHRKHGHEHDGDRDAAMAELLDLDAEVLHAYLDEVLGWVAGALEAPERMLDLGAGTGQLPWPSPAGSRRPA